MASGEVGTVFSVSNMAEAGTGYNRQKRFYIKVMMRHIENMVIIYSK